MARLADANAFQALGLAYDADGAAVREAFLSATKKYHPSRFARMDREIVRLANEVFLLLKDAYTLLRDDAKRAALSEKYAPAASPAPRGRTESGAGSGASSRTGGRSIRQKAVSNRGAPTSGRGRRARTVPGAGEGSSRSRPSVGARAVHASSRRAQTSSPTVRGVGGSRIPRPTPASGRRDGEPISDRELAEFSEAAHRTGKQHVEAVKAKVTDTIRQRNEKFETALRLNHAGKHEEARKLLQQVAVEEPKEKKYRVYLHYVWATEHEAAERYEDARAEYRRALNIDPGFKRAHEALGRLETDKKGFFKKLFSR